MTKVDVHSIEDWVKYFESNETIATYKHSTRCGVSSMAWSRLERSWKSDMTLLFVDLIRHRELSNYIAQKTGVRHESPQLIISRGGNVIDHASHMEISGHWVESVENKIIEV